MYGQTITSFLKRNVIEIHKISPINKKATYKQNMKYCKPITSDAGKRGASIFKTLLFLSSTQEMGGDGAKRIPLLVRKQDAMQNR